MQSIGIIVSYYSCKFGACHDRMLLGLQIGFKADFKASIMIIVNDNKFWI